MRSMRFMLFSAAVLAMSALAVRAQTTGQIRGTVSDEAGKPLAGVSVQAATPAAGIRTFTTGKDGSFRFVSLPPGDYTVSFTLADYADVRKKATVRLDGTVTLNAKMFRVSG